MVFGIDDVADAVIGAGASMYSAREQAAAVADTNRTNMQIAAANNVASAKMASDQMAFQQRMSDTSVQRMVNDMKAAGVNPMLAAGAGESTPSGAMGSVQAPNVQPVPSVAANAISSAKDMLTTLVGVRKTLADADNSKAQAQSARASAGLSSAKTAVVGPEAKVAGWISNLIDRVGGWTAKQYQAAQDSLKSYKEPGSQAPLADGITPAPDVDVPFDMNPGGQ